jgi:hypothetical protein
MFEYAPSVDLLGSFFPIWMVCIAAAVVLTLGTRFLLIRARLDNELRPKLIVYPSMITAFACALWLALFRY